MTGHKASFNPTLVVLRKVVILVSTILISVAFAIAIRFSLYMLPHAIYRRDRPTAATECQRVKPGMTMAEVEYILNQKMPPYELYYDQQSHELISRREFATACVVEFDPASNQAVRAFVIKQEIAFPEP